MKCVVSLVFWVELSEASDFQPQEVLDRLENRLLGDFGHVAATQLQKLEPVALAASLRGSVEPVVGAVWPTWKQQRQAERDLLSEGSRWALGDFSEGGQEG